MQPLATLRIATPCLPGGEEIQALPKPRLDNDKLLAPGPASGQTIATEKHVMRLRQTSTRAVIDIVIAGRIGSTVTGQNGLGGLENARHGKDSYGRKWRRMVA